MKEIRQDLELLSVEDLVVGIYQQKFLKEPSKTWVRSLLDVAMWDYSSHTRYLQWFWGGVILPSLLNLGNRVGLVFAFIGHISLLNSEGIVLA